jgi:hypothetical protein
MSERLDELYKAFYELRSRVGYLSGSLGEMVKTMMYINDELDSLRSHVIKLDIGEEGREKLLSLTNEYQAKFLEVLIEYAKDAVVRKLSTAINDLTKG